MLLLFCYYNDLFIYSHCTYKANNYSIKFYNNIGDVHMLSNSFQVFQIKIGNWKYIYPLRNKQIYNSIFPKSFSVNTYLIL